MGCVQARAIRISIPAAANSGRYHHCPTSVKKAMSSGERAVPRPNSTLRAVRATSRRSGMKAPA